MSDIDKSRSPFIAQDAEGNRLIATKDVVGNEPALGGENIVDHAMEFIDTFIKAPDNPSRNSRQASNAIDLILNKSLEVRKAALDKLFGVYKADYDNQLTAERAWENVTVLISHFWAGDEKASIGEKKAIITCFKEELQSDRIQNLSWQQQRGLFNTYSRSGLETRISIVADWQKDATDDDKDLREHAIKSLIESADGVSAIYDLLRRRRLDSPTLSKETYEHANAFFENKTAGIVESTISNTDTLPSDFYDVFDGRVLCAIYSDNVEMAEKFISDVIALNYESLAINSHYQSRHEFLKSIVAELAGAFPQKQDEWKKQILESGRITENRWDEEIRFKRNAFGGNGMRP